MTWFASADETSVQGAPVQTLGPHLYDGVSGVAVFLAAYHRVTGVPESRDLALRAVAPLKAKLRQMAAAPGLSRPLPVASGGFVGLGSFLYAFLLLARFLEREELLGAARDAAALMTRERILADQRFDLVHGCAGALLALLRLEGEPALPQTERSKALDLAAVCGRHLLSRQTAQHNGLRAWPALPGPAISGFAHGAAGIGHALLRLFERTGETELRDAALEGFAFERSLYDSRAGTWLDPRNGRLIEQAAWCHGGPGIALSRVYASAAVEDRPLAEEMEHVLALTRELPDCSREHLCCGTCGRVEILFTAGRALGRAELVREAWQLATRVVERAATARSRFVTTGGGRERPLRDTRPSSLFLGTAGVGYTLLRLRHPDRLPCVLRLE